MCLIKTPKITAPDPDAPENKPAIFRNPFLDGVGPQFAAQTAGRNSLRIGLGSGVNARFLERNSIPGASVPTNPNPTAPNAGRNALRQARSGSSGGGGGGDFGFPGLQINR